MTSDLRVRLRWLLRIMAVLALVSAGVNYRRWARSGDGGVSPQPPVADSLALQIEHQQQWTAAHPDDAAGRQALARLLFMAHRFPEAEAQLAALQKQQPRSAEIHYWLSLVQKQSGQLDAALRNALQAQRLDPRRATFQEWLGEIYLAQGRSEEAASTFDASLKKHPASYAALMGKARAMEQLYEAKLPVPIPEIVTPVEKAVRLQPQNPAGLTVLARMTFAYLQHFDRAEQLAHQAIRLDPNQAEPYLILVEISLNNPTPANTAQAVTWAQQAARLDPNSPVPLYLLGRALLRRNDLPGAIAALERATQVQMMPEAVYQLSLAYARAGDRERAAHYSRLYQTWNRFVEQRKLLLALLQHRPRDIGLHAQLAELYLAQGAREPARNWARKGLQLRPQDPRLRRLLARVDDSSVALGSVNRSP
jgi:tetratricopeptide (TPR) repeat protein